jgi:hypothetical protein
MTLYQPILNGDLTESNDVFEYPPDFDEKRIRMLDSIIAEFRRLFVVVLTSELDMMITACRSAQREEVFSLRAQQYFESDDLARFDLFLRHARAEAALKRQSLLVLRLVGQESADRGQLARKGAANQTGAIGVGQNGGGDRWANLLPSQ